MNLRNVSLDELEKEIKRRKKQERLPPPMAVAPDYDSIRECVENINKEMIEQNYNDEDNKHWIYEAVIKALYGDNADKYFNWLSQIGS